MTIEAQILVHRENLQTHSGPDRLESNAQTRPDAGTSGQSNSGGPLISYEPELVARRIAQWTAYRAPRTDRERWLVEQVALATVRVDYCQIEENALRSSVSQRASICWDEERLVDAEELGARLHRSPALTVAKLKRTVQGCGWLSERWESLERIALTGDWNDAQRDLALDMLGVPSEFREKSSHLPIGPDSQALGDLARVEIKKIAKVIARGLTSLDEGEQRMAMSGLSCIFTPGAIRLRRYAAEAMKIYWWAERELKTCLMEPAPAFRNEPNPPPIAQAETALTNTPKPEMAFRNEPNPPPSAPFETATNPTTNLTTAEAVEIEKEEETVENAVVCEAEARTTVPEVRGLIAKAGSSLPLWITKR